MSVISGASRALRLLLGGFGRGVQSNLLRQFRQVPAISRAVKKSGLAAHELGIARQGRRVIIFDPRKLPRGFQMGQGKGIPFKARLSTMDADEFSGAFGRAVREAGVDPVGRTPLTPDPRIAQEMRGVSSALARRQPVAAAPGIGGRGRPNVAGGAGETIIGQPTPNEVFGRQRGVGERGFTREELLGLAPITGRVARPPNLSTPPVSGGPSLGQRIRQRPLFSANVAAGVGAGGLFAANVAMDAEPGVESQLAERQSLKHQLAVIEAERQRLRQAVARNATLLAGLAPDVYNKVLAGEDLPKGARVIGGGQRKDLLEELLLQMSTGGYTMAEQNPMDSLLAQVGEQGQPTNVDALFGGQ